MNEAVYTGRAGRLPIRRAAGAHRAVTLETFTNLADVSGGFSVLGSVLDAILESRRNTQTVRASSAWTSDVPVAELNEGVAHNQQLSELATRAMKPETPPEDPTPAEFGQLFVLYRAVLQKYQAQWFLWTEGHLSDEMGQYCRRWAKSFMSLPVPGRVWEREADQHQYAAGFIESVNSMEASSGVSFSARSVDLFGGPDVWQAGREKF